MDKLKDMTAVLMWVEFNPTDIDTDLHKRVAGAIMIQDGFIMCFDLCMKGRVRDQELSMWKCNVEEVVREIMRDKRFRGHQNFSFEASLEDDGLRLYGGKANAAVSF